MDFSRKAVVLLSGGMDSLVTCALAMESYSVAALHVRYGQRTAPREERAFSEICDFYRISDRLVTDLPALGQIGGSSLTDRTVAVTEANLTASGIPSSYVPFRNAHLLSIAVSWAEVLGASAVFIGAVEEDSSGYPDCRRQFYTAFESAVREGTKPETDISIVVPVISMHKAEIVRTGAELDAPFELSWSCYRNTDTACGTCDSCALRLRAFRAAGLDDPLPYATRPAY